MQILLSSLQQIIMEDKDGLARKTIGKQGQKVLKEVARLRSRMLVV